MTMSDQHYMHRALELAARGLYTTAPNPRVGCVIANHHEIIGEGWHQVAGEPHAEVYALQQAGIKAHGASLYVTLEPCAHSGLTLPCVDTIVAAGIARVVVAMIDPNPQVSGKGIAQLQAAGITVEVGTGQEAAIKLNRGFISRMTRHRPFVRVKSAMSLDGRTAMANGESQWITSAKAREDVQLGRASSGAILSGIGTVLADDPLLNVRLPHVTRQPLRVILDSQLRLSPQAKLFSSPGAILVATCSQDFKRRQALEQLGAEVAVLPATENNQVQLLALLQLLTDKKINDVWVEAGSRLTGALVAARLVDECIIYMAPKLLGNEGRGLMHLPHLTHLKDAVELLIEEIVAIGDDWRITAKVK